MNCEHTRGRSIAPGWGCCKCHTYNGYQRTRCKTCGHKHCYEIESAKGKEALHLQTIGGDPALVVARLRQRAYNL